MMNIQLPLTSKQQTVTDIVKDVMGGEKLEGDNQYNCTVCVKKCDAVKKMEFTSLPPTCVYQVLRSKYDRY
jgi:ubiquitin C-terminal hydrolase